VRILLLIQGAFVEDAQTNHRAVKENLTLEKQYQIQGDSSHERASKNLAASLGLFLSKGIFS
jgi:hypothetical protein